MKFFTTLFLCISLAVNNLSAQYPLLPQDIQHYINGTVGEERHVGGAGTAPRHRYHYGLDFASNGNVHAIEGGVI